MRRQTLAIEYASTYDRDCTEEESYFGIGIKMQLCGSHFNDEPLKITWVTGKEQE